jgi:tetratricopeptide (TPR) repeat protein
VLQGANSAEVKTSDGKTYPITHIVAFDEQNDIIRLSVNIPSKYVLPLSLSETTPEIGERIIVYGSPLGLEKTLSDGIISAIREVPGYGKLIQITAPISPGSSGSPVLNMKGEVIGIATFQFIEGQNLNFAIPSERIANLDLMENLNFAIPSERIANLDLKKETYPYLKKYRKSEEKKDFDYAYEAYSQAKIFIDREEYEEALPYLEIATKTDFLPIKAIVYHIIGFCYSELGNYSKAIGAYKQVIHIDPDNFSAYSSLGGVYFGLGNFTKAIEAYQQVIRIAPNDAFAYNILGVSYLALSNYAKAIEAYQQAIRIDPDNFVAHDGLGLVYHTLSNYAKAIEAYQQAIRINPNIAATYSVLGQAYGNLGNYIKAMESFKQAIRIDPDYARAHFLLGVTYLMVGDRSSALNEYKILKELDIDLANELFDLIY